MKGVTILKKNYFFIFFSLFITCFFVAGIFAKDRSFSAYENRYLASYPSFSIAGCMDGSYMEAMDTYLNDQFVLRDSWIRLKANTEKELLGRKVIKDVYLADKDYLINRYTEANIDRALVAQNILYLNEFQEKYAAEVMLVPTAGEILTKYLPSPVDQLDIPSLLSDAHTTIPAFELLKEHDTEPVYYKTDHHWTLLGAYYLYQSFVPDAYPYAATDICTDFQGTISKKLGGSRIFDSMAQFQSPTDNHFQVTYDNTTVTDSLYAPAYLDTTDQYSYYLDGNHAITKIENLSLADTAPSILIVKDSFANTFATMLCENYKTVYLIDLRYYNQSLADFIATENIPEVLFLYNTMNFMQDKNLLKLLR